MKSQSSAARLVKPSAQLERLGKGAPRARSPVTFWHTAGGAPEKTVALSRKKPFEKHLVIKGQNLVLYVPIAGCPLVNVYITMQNHHF